MIDANHGVVIGTFLAYFGVMFVIGVVAYRRSSNFSDYVLGGRTLGPFATAISSGASEMSGWLLIAMPGAAFLTGMSSFWIAAGLLAGTLLNWLIVARRLRVYSFIANNALTIPEYLAERFQDRSLVLRLIAAAFIIIFYLFYTSSGLVAGGKLLNTVFGLDYSLAVFLGALAVVSYTFFGGYLAVSWTDVIQGIMMFLALIIVPLAAIYELDGVGEAFSAAEGAKAGVLNGLMDASTGEWLTWMTIVSSLAWGLGYFGQPHSLARFAGINDARNIPMARRIAVSWTAIGMVGALLVGILGNAYFPGGLDDHERIFMVMVDIMFNPVVAGVLLTTVLAAVMSTADSQLLVCSSVIADDIYKAVFRQQASQKELVMVGRITVLAVSSVAVMLALNPDSSVLGLVSYAWAGFGAAFGPTLIASLFWPRMNQWGALAGVVVGGLTVIAWAQLNGGIFDLYEILPAFILSALAIVIVTLVTPRPSEAVGRQFQSMLKEVK
ncbi:sodium/proline symporter [Chromohalobacter japonicus]|uniref:Sodium/proline symporter n=1 Tax=Chromohalobacter japonicus TaxID=223900 RepID=A0A1Q8T895_9GAMM|nr:sodium/proline symporter PutP [Chromohalobacter japonicus]OLO09903.1 sodium/proline symporter [Chromohalobacter japonicus]CDQ33144.1 Propionate transporter [Virgibacillus halodenitrificans]